jgi:hypothetical protein
METALTIYIIEMPALRKAQRRINKATSSARASNLWICVSDRRYIIYIDILIHKLLSCITY